MNNTICVITVLLFFGVEIGGGTSLSYPQSRYDHTAMRMTTFFTTALSFLNKTYQTLPLTLQMYGTTTTENMVNRGKDRLRPPKSAYNRTQLKLTKENGDDALSSTPAQQTQLTTSPREIISWAVEAVDALV